MTQTITKPKSTEADTQATLARVMQLNDTLAAQAVAGEALRLALVAESAVLTQRLAESVAANARLVGRMEISKRVAEPVAEICACDGHGDIIQEIDGRLKFLRIGDMLYANVAMGGFTSEMVQQAYDNGYAAAKAVPLASMPELQSAIAAGLANGTLQLS